MNAHHAHLTTVDPLRIAPHDIGAEQQVIGAIMCDETALHRVSDWLGEHDFYRADHRAVWTAFVELAAAGKPVDLITVMGHLDTDNDPELRGYLLDLSNTQASSANIVAHAEIVLEHSRLRQVIDVGTRTTEAAYARGADSGALVAAATHDLMQLSTERHTGLQPIKAAARTWFHELAKLYDSGERMTGRVTPWKDVNELTLGLRPGELIVLAGRPGMGKSVGGFSLAAFDACRGGRPAVFSLEMAAVEFVQRSVAALGNVPHEWLRAPKKGEGSDEQWDKVNLVMRQLVASKLLIDDQPSLTIAQIAARARRAHLQEPLTMVVIDHMHIVRIKGGDNTVRELGDISRGAKALAKQLGVPVVLLAQLNRSNTARSDKRPTMTDLRGSGEIEQDADYILLLHREDYYDEQSHAAGLVELVVGKARNAKASSIHLRNRLDVMRFDDWDGALPEPPSTPPPPKSRGYDPRGRAAGAP